jgi:hypothetical protein
MSRKALPAVAGAKNPESLTHPLSRHGFETPRTQDGEGDGSYTASDHTIRPSAPKSSTAVARAWIMKPGARLFGLAE